ncbi:hypothetical protein [Micavibrio aeruginosavorus]|uniref:hypothetical protein n=1 Tax=Micavibrio aeruginosavorus TaxID=349221 RepID=UPI00059FD171|nr:hypothetical protein [Micavibrio aeruginosavorus]
MTISTRDPVDMTGEERMQEIAAILAAGIQRHQNNQLNQSNNAHFERSLTGLPSRRKHSCDHAENQSGDK